MLHVYLFIQTATAFMLGVSISPISVRKTPLGCRRLLDKGPEIISIDTCFVVSMIGNVGKIEIGLRAQLLGYTVGPNNGDSSTNK